MHQSKIRSGLSKFCSQKKKGNISLLVIFILLASALIGLLAMSFVQNLLQYGHNTYSYFRSYYLAKAGVELSFSEIYSRGIGFEMVVSSGDSIVLQNFTGAFDPKFTSMISGAAKTLTKDFILYPECSSETAISLSGGQSYILPLFKEDIYSSHKDAFGEGKPLLPLSLSSVTLNVFTPSDAFAFALIVIDEHGDLVDYVVKKGGTLQTFLSDSAVSSLLKSQHQKYFAITNTKDQPLKFCISSSDFLPTPLYAVTSLGNFGGNEIGIAANFRQPIPDFLSSVLSISDKPN